MKRMLKVFIALTASALLWASQANAVVIGIDNVVEGANTVTMDVVATDLGADIIVAYNMDILFDGFTGASVAFNDVLSLLFAPAIYGVDGIVGNILDNVAGISFAFFDADYDELALLQNSDPLVLFTITWDWDGASEYDVSFIWDVLNGEDVKCAPNEVCFPATVPEPGTLGLLGLGLLGLGLARRRRSL